MRHVVPLVLLLLVPLAGCENPTQLRPVTGGFISSGFGPRPTHPVRGATPGGHHDGYDFAVAEGSPVRATQAGTVRFAGTLGGYGKTVILDHGEGLSTLYGHASALEVSAGQAVAAGATIARVGSTGISTGPHLHYELRRNGVAIDPGPFLDEAAAPRRAVAAVKPPAPKPQPPAPPAVEPPSAQEMPVDPLRFVGPGRHEAPVPPWAPGRVIEVTPDVMAG